MNVLIEAFKLCLTYLPVTVPAPEAVNAPEVTANPPATEMPPRKLAAAFTVRALLALAPNTVSPLAVRVPARHQRYSQQNLEHLPAKIGKSQGRLNAKR